MATSPRTAGKQGVGAILERCCARTGACRSGHCHGKETAESVPDFLDDPGRLEAKGPLSKDSLLAIEKLTGTTARPEHRVSLLANGAESYATMFRLVEQARHEVLVENFIFRADDIGKAFADSLRVRGEAGASVQVLHDPFGSLMTGRLPIGFRFSGARASLRVYNPPIPRLDFFRWGRDHRKVLVQDCSRAVVGGLCLADVWAGNCVAHCTWRDSALYLEGPAVQNVRDEFLRMWGRGLSFAIGTTGVASRSLPAAPKVAGAVPVRVVADERGKGTVENVLRVVFSSAREEILITNPYFLPTPRLAGELIAASKRGVAVRVLIPGDNEQRWVARVVEGRLKAFFDAGIEFWRWSGPLIHAKTVVVDRSWCLVGSSNLDNLSLRKNSELNLEVHGSALGERMAEMFHEDCEGSERFLRRDYDRRSLPRKWSGVAGRVFIPWM